MTMSYQRLHVFRVLRAFLTDFFIDKDVNFIVLCIQPMLSETLTESVLLKH